MMTYEEKFDFVVTTVWQARDFTMKGCHPKLKITEENGLKNLDPDKIASILFKLQAYKIIKKVSTARASFFMGTIDWRITTDECEELYKEIRVNYEDRQLWLPLKDLFCNHKLEFDISLSDLKIAFDEMGLKQPRFVFA